MAIVWAGVFPAVTTEMDAHGALAMDATARHLEFLLAGGVQGMVMVGTVGENTSLDRDEKLAVCAWRWSVARAVCRCSAAWPSTRRRVRAALRKTRPAPASMG